MRATASGSRGPRTARGRHRARRRTGPRPWYGRRAGRGRPGRPGATSSRSPPTAHGASTCRTPSEAQRPQVGAVVDQVRRVGVPGAVPGQERDPPAGHLAHGDRRGRVRRTASRPRPPRRPEERVEAGAADDGDLDGSDASECAAMPRVCAGRVRCRHARGTSSAVRPGAHVVGGRNAAAAATPTTSSAAKRFSATNPSVPITTPGHHSRGGGEEPHHQVGGPLDVGAHVQRGRLGQQRGRGHRAERPAEPEQEETERDLHRRAFGRRAREQQGDQQHQARRRSAPAVARTGPPPSPTSGARKNMPSTWPADHDADDLERGTAVVHVQRRHHHHRDHHGVGESERRSPRRDPGVFTRDPGDPLPRCPGLVGRLAASKRRLARHDQRVGPHASRRSPQPPPGCRTSRTGTGR